VPGAAQRQVTTVIVVEGGERQHDLGRGRCADDQAKWLRKSPKRLLSATFNRYRYAEGLARARVQNALGRRDERVIAPDVQPRLVCQSVRNSNPVPSRVTYIANFDLEDSDDLAALLGKRYGL
jgi:hypothetical protein